MHDRQPVQDEPRSTRPARRIPAGLLAGLSVILITGSATAWWTWNTVSEKPSTTVSTPNTISQPIPTNEPIQSQPNAVESAPVETEETVQVYWLKDTGTEFELVPASITVAADKPDEVLTMAMEALLTAEPESADVASTIPPETKLLDLQVKDDGVHVDLSDTFVTGGGSASMVGRLGQVIYTATSLDPTTPVWVSVEGEPLEVLGGEGVLVKQPMTRDEFEQSYEF
ncbi:MAG: spore germination protein [Leptolyngbyaceae cyanobacterium SL_7_1]|nr:spore germination protein [Leptolyngbyaceae cyanobacterium SL_7_1]